MIVRGELADDWFEMTRDEWVELVMSAPRLRAQATPAVSLIPEPSDG